MAIVFTVQVWNRTANTLTFKNPANTHGPLPQSSAATVAPNASAAVTIGYNNPSNGMNASFEFVDASGNAFDFECQQITGKNNIQVQWVWRSSGATVGLDTPVSTALNSTVTANLYMGVPAYPAQGFAVPLSATPYLNDNAQDFANSMFGVYMRQQIVIDDANDQTTVPFKPADFTGGQTGNVVAALLDGWTSGTGLDGPIMQFLSAYLAPPGGQAAPMMMWVPKIAYQSLKTPDQPVYQLTGYVAFPLAGLSGTTVAWNREGLSTFLTLLLGGAHFVAISAYNDLTTQGISTGQSRSLYDAFKACGLPQRWDWANTHYEKANRTIKGKPLPNETGQYYLKIADDWAPPMCGFILALMFGSTVNFAPGFEPAAGTFNTFMQLEGWPLHGTSQDQRHAKDLDIHEATLWNISTYGACPYSEKRGTTVFLAPAGWTPTIYQTTMMMPYVGAYAVEAGQAQPWLNTAVVNVPSDTPALPSKYILGDADP